MQSTPTRTRRDTREIYQDHLKTVYRIAFTYMKNTYDAEDAVQETFVRLIRSETGFADREHEKAWLIVTVSNVCKDMLKSRKRTEVSLDEQSGLPAPASEPNAVLEAILALPDLYKTAVYLFYCEGYTAREIAAMLGEKPNTVMTHIRRARGLMKKSLGGDFHA